MKNMFSFYFFILYRAFCMFANNYAKQMSADFYESSALSKFHFHWLLLFKFSNALIHYTSRYLSLNQALCLLIKIVSNATTWDPNLRTCAVNCDQKFGACTSNIKCLSKVMGFLKRWMAFGKQTIFQYMGAIYSSHFGPTKTFVFIFSSAQEFPRECGWGYFNSVYTL